MEKAMVCECGAVLTDDEIRFNVNMHKIVPRTVPIQMCENCWADYCHHAETGD